MGSGDEDGDLSDSDIESAEEEEDVRRWGSKKKYYYGGNTGEELEHELGDSDLEEDKIEEQEAAMLQSRQIEMMDEEDFLDAFVVKKAESKEKEIEPKDSIARDLSKLSRKEQVKLFKQQSPEFAGVVADFQLRMGDAVKLAKVTAMAEGGALPDGPAGLCQEQAGIAAELLHKHLGLPHVQEPWCDYGLAPCDWKAGAVQAAYR